MYIMYIMYPQDIHFGPYHIHPSLRTSYFFSYCLKCSSQRCFLKYFFHFTQVTEPTSDHHMIKKVLQSCLGLLRAWGARDWRKPGHFVPERQVEDGPILRSSESPSCEQRITSISHRYRREKQKGGRWEEIAYPQRSVPFPSNFLQC